MNCGPEFCGTVPRSAGSLFLAGEARRNCSGPARRYGFPPAHVAGRGTTSTSCKHFSVTGRPTSKTTTSAPGTGKSLPKRWWPELVAAECDTDRLAIAANVTHDTDRGPNIRQARALPTPKRTSLMRKGQGR